MKGSNPNILLVHSHDLGRHLGTYDRGVDTPHVDEMAANGAVFDNYFATAPQCSPSRGSQFTGLYPHENGLMGLAHTAWEFRHFVKALPEYLVEAGYETHLFGLQHVTDSPSSVGFEHVHSEGNLLPASDPIVHEVNRARRVADTFDMFIDKESYHEPFFASVGFFELHRIMGDELFGFDEGRYEAPDPEDVTVPPYLPDSEGMREDLAAMNGMLTAVDDAVGKIRRCLRKTGLVEDTVVLFTTEHGIAFPRAKGSCYDPGIEAALVIEFPGEIEGGERYDQLLSNVDLLPTILDLVEGVGPAEISGRSFLPLVTDENYLPRECLFAEMSWHDHYNPVRAIRTDRFKYIRSFWHLPAVYLSTDIFLSKAGRDVREEYYAHQRPYEELYDLSADPLEQTDVAGDESYETIRAELENKLFHWMQRTNDPLLDGPIPPPDYDEIRAWTRTLRY